MPVRHGMSQREAHPDCSHHPPKSLLHDPYTVPVLQYREIVLCTSICWAWMGCVGNAGNADVQPYPLLSSELLISSSEKRGGGGGPSCHAWVPDQGAHSHLGCVTTIRDDIKCLLPWSDLPAFSAGSWCVLFISLYVHIGRPILRCDGEA